MFHRSHPEMKREKDAGGYLGRIVSVNDDVVEYREWVASVWSSYSAPLITQVSPSVPTYASIANRHVQPGLFKTQVVTTQNVSSKNATWPRSQSNVETLVAENRITIENEPLVKHPSADCLYSLAGGIQMKVNKNSVWTATSVRKLADSLAQDNVSKRKVAGETKTFALGGTPKSPSNSRPVFVNSSETIKQSATSSLKQTLATWTEASVVDSTVKSKALSSSGLASSKASLIDSTSKSKVVSSSGTALFKTAVDSSTSKLKTVPSTAPVQTKASVVDLTLKTKAVSVSSTSVVDSVSKPKTSCISGLTSTKTSTVDSLSKPKTVSGPTSCGLQKKTDEQKMSASNNNVSSIKMLRF